MYVHEHFEKNFSSIAPLLESAPKLLAGIMHNLVRSKIFLNPGIATPSQGTLGLVLLSFKSIRPSPAFMLGKFCGRAVSSKISRLSDPVLSGRGDSVSTRSRRQTEDEVSGFTSSRCAANADVDSEEAAQAGEGKCREPQREIERDSALLAAPAEAFEL